MEVGLSHSEFAERRQVVWSAAWERCGLEAQYHGPHLRWVRADAGPAPHQHPRGGGVGGAVLAAVELGELTCLPPSGSHRELNS